jgi:subtilisin family serine protease
VRIVGPPGSPTRRPGHHRLKGRLIIRRSLVALGASGLLIATLVPAGVNAQGPTRPNLTLPKAIEQDRLTKPVRDKHVAERAKIALSLTRPRARTVFVRLSSTPAAEFGTRGPAAVMAQVRVNRSQQARVIAVARTLDKSVKIRPDRPGLERRGDADRRQLDPDPGQGPAGRLDQPGRRLPARAVRDGPVYRRETVQKAGFKGTAIKVGVVDSGIDYTHKEFGGPGTVPAYEAAYGTGPTDPKNTTTDGLFPTARVVGGWDFVGESWPGTDPDNPRPRTRIPIRSTSRVTGPTSPTSSAGPRASPRRSASALKVCSAVATSCSASAFSRPSTGRSTRTTTAAPRTTSTS